MFNRLESVLVGITLLLNIWVVIVGCKGIGGIPLDGIVTYAIIAVLLFLLVFFTNPNTLSFHRFYRKQLADLFLRFSGD